MPTVYHFLSERNQSVINEWIKRERIPKDQLMAVREKINSYRQGGKAAMPGLIAGPIVKDVYKLKIKGNRGWKQLRPMCCYGPFADDGNEDITLLIGAVERDFKLDPRDAPARAQSNRTVLLGNRTRRRNERIEG